MRLRLPSLALLTARNWYFWCCFSVRDKMASCSNEVRVIPLCSHLFTKHKTSCLSRQYAVKAWLVKKTGGFISLVWVSCGQNRFFCIYTSGSSVNNIELLPRGLFLARSSLRRSLMAVTHCQGIPRFFCFVVATVDAVAAGAFHCLL